MNKSHDQNTEWTLECISYVLLGCTNLFKQLNKMKVLGYALFWVCFGAVLCLLVCFWFCFGGLFLCFCFLV